MELEQAKLRDMKKLAAALLAANRHFVSPAIQHHVPELTFAYSGLPLIIAHVRFQPPDYLSMGTVAYPQKPSGGFIEIKLPIYAIIRVDGVDSEAFKKLRSSFVWFDSAEEMCRHDTANTKIYMSVADLGGYSTTPPDEVLGIIAHEIGHFVQGAANKLGMASTHTPDQEYTYLDGQKKIRDKGFSSTLDRIQSLVDYSEFYADLFATMFLGYTKYMSSMQGYYKRLNVPPLHRFELLNRVMFLTEAATNTIGFNAQPGWKLQLEFTKLGQDHFLYLAKSKAFKPYLYRLKEDQ